MAFENPIPGGDLPFRASANVTALTYTGNPPLYSSGGLAQYTVVTQDTGTGLVGDIIQATSTTVAPMGVIQDGPATGTNQSARVRVLGVSKVIAGAAITVDALLMVNGSGQVVTATAPGATNIFLVGRALTAATASGDEISVYLMLGTTQQVNA